MPQHPRTILGLDIGGTKIACIEGNRAAEVLQRVEMATEASRPFDETLPQIIGASQRLIAAASASARKIVALSVSIGGPLRIGEGVLIDPPNLPGWHGVRLKDRLSESFPGLPVCIEHDGNAGALAEFHFGAGRARAGVRHLIFLTFGTGLGAGIIVNGQILHGASDTAGEIGHWRLSRHGPEGFGKAGSWEGFSSGAGLVKLAASKYPLRWQSQSPIRTLIDAMLANDDDALAVAREAGRRLGQGLALLIDALNPQLIVLGSLAVALGERVLGPAREVIAAEALPQAAAACEIVPAALGANIGDVAALMAVLNDPQMSKLLENRHGDE
jgi:glucokinase